MTNQVVASEEQHCPFSKPLFGKCCECPHAEFYDQRTRRVNCTRLEEFRPRCLKFDEFLLGVSHALPGMENSDDGPSFSQLMKSRCGGMRGIKRVIQGGVDDTVVVPDIIDLIKKQYGNISAFPYAEISEDILSFNIRKRKPV